MITVDGQAVVILRALEAGIHHTQRAVLIHHTQQHLSPLSSELSQVAGARAPNLGGKGARKRLGLR